VKDFIDLGPVPDCVAKEAELVFKDLVRLSERPLFGIKEFILDLDTGSLRWWRTAEANHTLCRIEIEHRLRCEHVPTNLMAPRLLTREQAQTDNQFVGLPESLLLLVSAIERSVYALNCGPPRVFLRPRPPLEQIALPSLLDLWMVFNSVLPDLRLRLFTFLCYLLGLLLGTFTRLEWHWQVGDRSQLWLSSC
jgi:hypothetical protein